MKVPLSWLKEHISTPSSAKSIAESLTLLGLEVDDIVPSDSGFEDIVVVIIEKIEKISQKHQLLTIFDGFEHYQVVTTAPNCKIGMKTAYAKIGAKVIKSGKEIIYQEKKIENKLSQGALVSHEELGISDSPYGVAQGVMEFTSHIPIGQDLRTLFGDPILHLSLTPNLGHAASMRGVARELAAAENLSLNPLPSLVVPRGCLKKNIPLKITIENANLCSRYASCLIEGITVGPSPDWLKKRVIDAGMQSVNNVVDATNYLMLDLGLPLHAFDADTLDDEIIIRKAAPKEAVVTLDGKKHLLSEDQLVVGSKKRIYAIAGIMGSIDTEVKSTTTSVLLECACFAPQAIRKSSKSLSLATQASYRFERGIDQEAVPYVLMRAAYLIAELGQASSVSEIQERKFEDCVLKKISLKQARVNQLLGTHFSLSELESLLKRVHLLLFARTNDSLILQIPSFRHDLKEEIDLVEEVARVYGYHHLIKKDKPKYRKGNLQHSLAYQFERKTIDSLLRLGLTEVITCDLISDKQALMVGDDWVSFANRITLLNPSSLDYSILRFSLLPGLLEIAKTNIDHGVETLSLFEVGRIHLREKENFLEPYMVGILLLGGEEIFWQNKGSEQDFYTLKGYVERFFDTLFLKNISYSPSKFSSLHPYRQAQIQIGERRVGIMGEIHPEILQKAGIDQRVFFAECKLEEIACFVPKRQQMHSLSLYPSMKRDCTLALDKKTAISDILALIREQNSLLLESVYVIDLYQHESLPKNQVNVTIRLTYRSPDRTLSIKEVDEEHNRLMEKPKRLQV